MVMTVFSHARGVRPQGEEKAAATRFKKEVAARSSRRKQERERERERERFLTSAGRRFRRSESGMTMRGWAMRDGECGAEKGQRCCDPAEATKDLWGVGGDYAEVGDVVALFEGGDGVEV